MRMSNNVLGINNKILMVGMIFLVRFMIQGGEVIFGRIKM